MWVTITKRKLAQMHENIVSTFEYFFIISIDCLLQYIWKGYLFYRYVFKYWNATSFQQNIEQIQNDQNHPDDYHKPGFDFPDFPSGIGIWRGASGDWFRCNAKAFRSKRSDASRFPMQIQENQVKKWQLILEQQRGSSLQRRLSWLWRREWDSFTADWYAGKISYRWLPCRLSPLHC